jgi:hypothetical protein
MFLVHKQSIVQRLLPRGNYEDILVTEVQEGDTLRGYDLFAGKFTKHKVLSKVSLMARKINLKTSIAEATVISEDTYIASTVGAWMYRSNVINVKLFKKNERGYLLTPKPISAKLDMLDVFISIATTSTTDTMLVDQYIYVTKDWNGLKIKSMGSTGITSSLDEGSGTQPSID